MKTPLTFNPKSKFFISNKDLKWVFVDLDNCIVESFPPDFQIRRLKNGALRVLRKIIKRGYKIIIFTSRHWTEYKYIEESLKKYKVPFKSIICGKPMGALYIDDRAIGLSDWEKQEEEILSRL